MTEFEKYMQELPWWLVGSLGRWILFQIRYFLCQLNIGWTTQGWTQQKHREIYHLEWWFSYQKNGDTSPTTLESACSSSPLHSPSQYVIPMSEKHPKKSKPDGPWRGIGQNILSLKEKEWPSIYNRITLWWQRGNVATWQNSAMQVFLGKSTINGGFSTATFDSWSYSSYLVVCWEVSWVPWASHWPAHQSGMTLWVWTIFEP